MSAAPTYQCPACRGYPHRYGRGCTRCGDTGRVELTGTPPEPARPRVHPYAIERAQGRIFEALRGTALDHPSRTRAARIIAEGLAHEPDDVLRGVIAWARVGRERATVIVEAYVSAIREHARGRAYHAALRGERSAEADALHEHADRIERGLRVPMAEAAE